MKNFHGLSFGLGLASGLLVLIVGVGAMRMIGGRNREFGPGVGAGNFRQMQGGAGMPNMARMAERMGMTEAELKSAIDSGKTMQEIATEHGIDMPMGRGMGMDQGGGRPMMNGSGSGSAMMTSSAGMTSSAAASSVSVQSSSVSLPQ